MNAGTFETKEAMEDAIPNGAEWLTSSLFYKVRPWSIKEWSQSRKVWIECFGLQPYAWSVNNLKAIGEAWGAVIGFNMATVTGKCMGSFVSLTNSAHIGQMESQNTFNNIWQGLAHPTPRAELLV